ncbi:MAG: pitrilysin family protein [Nanoarchaeota archaeon]
MIEKPRFFKKILKNGMTVIFEERKWSGVVSVAIAVQHGGLHEAEEEKGISHFIEHMLYRSTKNRTPKQISEDIEKNGGILNGFTEEELTAFWCKMPSKHLDMALDVLSDMILNPLFDEDEMNKERLVIFEEMKMRRDVPSIFITDKIQGLLYAGNLGHDLIGTEKSMNSITREKMREKFQKAYGSQNLILCVVGDCDFKSLCEFAEKNFKKSGFKIPEPKITLKNGQKIERKKGIDQANLILAYHAPRAFTKQSYVSQVLSCLMTGGMSSRLFQEIREKRNLAYVVKGGYNGAKRFGYNSIFVGTTADKVEIVKKLIIEEFTKLKTLSENELNQVKEQLIGNSKISREDSQGQMIDLLYNEVWGDAKRSYRYEENIRKVKLADVKKLAKINKYSFIALVPEDK